MKLEKIPPEHAGENPFMIGDNRMQEAMMCDWK